MKLNISSKKLPKREDVIKNLKEIYKYNFTNYLRSQFMQLVNDIGSDKISWKSINELYLYVKEQAIWFNSMMLSEGMAGAEAERQDAERRYKAEKQAARNRPVRQRGAF